MSVNAMAYVFSLNNIDPTDKFVLIAYVDHADSDGNNIYPSVERIAAKTGYTRRTVQRSTQKLEAMGLLICDGSGPKGTNKWQLNMNWQGVTDVQGDTQSQGDLQTQGGVPESPQGRTKVTPRGVPESPEPSINHPLTTIKPVVVEPQTEPQQPQRPNIYRVYESEIGALTPMVSEMLDEIDGEYPDGWFADAVREAKSTRTQVGLKYVEKILKRWKAEGRVELPKPKSKAEPYTGKIILPDYLGGGS